jgi:hypothetical protein
VNRPRPDTKTAAFARRPHTLLAIIFGTIIPSHFAIAQTFDLQFSKSFPFPYGGGPIGCSEIMTKQFCSTAPLSKTPEVAVEVLAGNANLLSIGLTPQYCLEIKIRLWVDHKGYEGRQCLAPLAHAVAHITIPILPDLEDERK